MVTGIGNNNSGCIKFHQANFRIKRIPERFFPNCDLFYPVYYYKYFLLLKNLWHCFLRLIGWKAQPFGNTIQRAFWFLLFKLKTTYNEK